ncbi:MAG: sulfurtransferase TusA family protein [Methylococcaceae bacterium]|nr:sulfurtransferase TusA family protein [Methylococcaceae bacterium]
MQEIHVELDTSGLMCPLPLLRLKKALQPMTSGQIIRVIATDPASVLDFGVFVEQSGHTLLARQQTEGVLYYMIRKG